MIYDDLNGGRFYNADAFEAMALIPDGSIDMVLADLPYGTTANKWDTVIPFDKLWAEYDRVCKDNAAIVLTAQPPFDKMLGASNIANLKYEWIWEKNKSTGFLNAKKQPLKAHENALVFYKKQCTYNPQMTKGEPYKVESSGESQSDNYGKQVSYTTVNEGVRYPRSVIIFNNSDSSIHPTQKPVALFEYMIRTYTNDGETVLDNTAGSGTTAIAAINANRKWICIERDEGYYKKAVERINNHNYALPL